MTSPQEAEKIVRRLTSKYGFLDEEMMNDIGRYNADYRRKIDENWLAMESAVSHSVKILAKQIYGSGARFVFELLQNAEDAFNKPTKSKDPPFIFFKIHPNHIVVDCNENGFTEQDLEAICAVGKSTKSAAHGYIGAKGIGFKSVFIAASRVHIQSGNFSFQFRHKKTDPGIGMVRPIWVDPVEVLPNPLTRMTLYLHDQGNKTEIDHLRNIITDQFEVLNETCLFFLRNLQQIKLEFYNINGELERVKEFCKRRINEHCVSLSTTSIVNRKLAYRNQIYHITKQKASNLALSDNREIPDDDEARRISSTAEVVLAFPLSGTHKPLIAENKQEIFAFLPLRKSDYKFLIHSDFDTNASRQDIVTTSLRNLQIRDWIAMAFLKAVSEFCAHDTLCYDWPMFLPSSANYDVFWAGLDSKIQDLMKKRPVLKSRNRKDLRLIDEVFILGKNVIYGAGQPIFDDPSKDLYVSPKYAPMAVEILKNYGLKSLSVFALLGLLRADLLSVNSRMHGKDTTDEWHSVVARLFNSWFDQGMVASQQCLKSLPLLPLREGKWTSTASGPVYLSLTENISIPEGLDLRVIPFLASWNIDRNTLFKNLGASKATVDQVRASIFKAFSSTGSRSYRELKSYLDFIYLTHQSGTHTWQEYAKLKVVTNAWKLEIPHRTDVYLPGTEHAYSPANLLPTQGTPSDLSVSFLDSKYMENIPKKPASLFHPSWERWLCDFAGIRERVRLVSLSGDSLSDAFMYVFKHRPERFLGLFQHLWSHEKRKLEENRNLRAQIENLSAKELCKVNFPLKFKETWLPVQHLRETVKRYMEHPEQFPFLKFEESDGIPQFGAEFRFLNQYFSVGKDDSVDFLLEILRCIERACPEPASVRQCDKVFDLYFAIYAKLSIANNELEARRKIKAFFSKQGILDPDEEAPAWTSSSSCLWVAPPDMVTAHSLRTLYSRILDDERLGNIENLFQRTLEIQNASLSHLVTELKALPDAKREDIRRIRTIYKYIDESTIPIADLRAEFEAYPLIYNETRSGGAGWYKISDCLWSSETTIRGKVVLDECWEAEKNFFIGKLGVKLLTLQMVYDELRHPHRSSTDEIKVAILSFNSLLQSQSTYLDPEPIRKARIFPVRYPNNTVVLRSMDVDFAIGDRDSLKAKFQPKISFLDFELEDVCRLKPFFEWMRLHTRYLSNCVEEDTSISNGLAHPISSHNRDLKLKAYYIARVAATFDSPRFAYDPHQLYEKLRTMTVMETDGISSILKVLQNKKEFVVEVATANEHIGDVSELLTIYVPKERRAQDFCFASVLPRKFAAWLMQHPISHIRKETIEIGAINALTSIFACDQAVLDDVLDDQGIIQVSFENEDESAIKEDESEINDGSEGNWEDIEEGGQETADCLETDSASSEQQLTPTRSSVNGSSFIPIGTSDPGHESGHTEMVVETISRQTHMSHQPLQQSRDGPLRAVVVQNQPQSPLASRNHASRYLSATLATHFGFEPSENTQYRAILDKVIEAARRATFPSRGAFDMSDMRDTLPEDVGNEDAHENFDGLDVIRRFRSTNQLERDKKIGAAGELYVFELLSQLGMPGWDISNWQSKIRTYVEIHPEYGNIEAWKDRETSDLVYSDTTGQFTDTLIGCGYLSDDEWHGARPKYYIEVKTTTGPCGTPFYMSGNQYKLMGRIHHSEDRSEVYMIFRVFLLTSDGIGMRIYLDPEQLKQDGRLVFTGQTWSVTPGAGTEAHS